MEENNSVSTPEVTPAKSPIGMIRPLIIISIIALVFLGLKSLKPEATTTTQSQPEVAGAVTTPTLEATPTEKTQPYTLEEVALHSQKNDCWFVVDGKVYDVTPSSSPGKHPGGDAILQGCGKDATVLFNTRPMGSKTPHSDKARDYLANFLIGVLAQ